VLKTIFDDKWKLWIWTCINQTITKEDMFTILLNHGYKWDVISQELNYQPEKEITKLRKQRQIHMNIEENYVNNPYKKLADNPKCHRIDTNFFEGYEVENFLTDQECDEYVQIMNPLLNPSTVTDPNADKSVRTSTTAYLNLDSDFIINVNNKMHSFMGIPIELAETPQGQKYLVGQEFKQHCDWFDKNSPYNTSHLNMGQRTWTFMVYLNDVEEGGETRFTKIDLNIKPTKGKAVIWNNLHENKIENPYTEHWGMPVLRGEKNIITKWFRERSANDQSISARELPQSP
jgi:prolyl 4-hydroxylase